MINEFPCQKFIAKKGNLKDIWFKQMLRRRLETAEYPEIEFVKNNSLSFDDGRIIGL